MEEKHLQMWQGTRQNCTTGCYFVAVKKTGILWPMASQMHKSHAYTKLG